MNIFILLIFTIINILKADSDGVNGNIRISTPVNIYDGTQLKEKLIYLWSFTQENILLIGLFLFTLGFIFYLISQNPFSSTNIIEDDYADELEILQPVMITSTKDKIKSNDKLSILSQNQYDTLYDLINEIFIHQKELIMFNESMTKERKKRELSSLEAKFNQILYFSLPKLSSSDSHHFIKGVFELLDEDLTKDVLLVSLKDILDTITLQEVDKIEIRKKIKRVTNKNELV